MYLLLGREAVLTPNNGFTGVLSSDLHSGRGITSQLIISSLFPYIELIYKTYTCAKLV
jgi:hypothetical protein